MVDVDDRVTGQIEFFQDLHILSEKLTQWDFYLRWIGWFPKE